MKPAFVQIITWAIKLAILGLVFGALNLVLVGGQWLWHYGDQTKLDLLKTELDSERTAIDGIESKLSALKVEMQEADEKGKEIKSWIISIEYDFSSGIPPDQYGAYKRAVQKHNDRTYANYYKYIVTDLFFTLHYGII